MNITTYISTASLKLKVRELLARVWITKLKVKQRKLQELQCLKGDTGAINQFHATVFKKNTCAEDHNPKKNNAVLTYPNSCRT